MNLEIGKYNEIAYRRAQNMLNKSNVAAIVQPMLSNISDIAVRFLADTQGRTICVESDGTRLRGGMTRKVEALKEQGKISKSEAQRFGEIEYTTFSNLIRKIKEGKELSDYDNILLMGLQYCNEEVWENGIDALLEKNKNAKTLELVEFSTTSRNLNYVSLGRIRGHVASFISEEEATRLGVCGLICMNETSVIESELRQKLKKINGLEDKELQEKLLKKANQITKLNKRLLTMYQSLNNDDDIEDILDEFRNGDKNDSNQITEEEFQQGVNEEMEFLELRNTIRKLLEEIGEAIGEKHEESELETLKREYEAISKKANEAEELLGEVEEVRAKGNSSQDDAR